MKRAAAFALIVGVAAGTALFGSGSAAAADTATVYAVHGIPDTPVDVYVDGALAINDFQPTKVAGPLSLPAGTHKIDLTAADATDDSKPILSTSADLAAGANVTVVTHLSASGAPEITAFSNDVSQIPAGQARLVVRHTAAAPAVDIRAGGKVVLPGVTNPNQGMLVVPAGTGVG